MPPRVPMHRRILLLVFIIIFLILAPAVVFFTAGYRWNAKKGIIERSGTLIIDTEPSGASVILNGARLPGRTPVTLQDIAPGTYAVRLTRDGYHAWEKTLEVKSELVSFVNNVRLWPEAEPALELEARSGVLALAPNQRALVFLRSVTGTSLTFYDLLSGDQQDVQFDQVPTGSVRLIWNQSSNSVLIRDDKHAWVASRGGAAGERAGLLPDGRFRWMDGRLTGALASRERYTYAVATGETRRERLPFRVVDEDDDYRLISVTGTARLSVIDRLRPQTRFELPDGNWRFADRLNGRLFLETNADWLGFGPAAGKSEAVKLPADGPPDLLPRGNETFLLSKSGGEIWYTTAAGQPELLIRTSQPIGGAFWHRDGYDIFYATRRELVTLNLDTRSGRRETVLASFDEIFGFAVARKYAYVSAVKGGRRGIWKIRVE